MVSCQGDNYARCFDMTGDQIADEMRVTLSKPKCISAIPVRNASLKVWQNPDDAGAINLECTRSVPTLCGK